MISDHHHDSYLQTLRPYCSKCGGLSKEDRDKGWNHKSMGSLRKECPKCGLLLVDQDFVESDFSNKKKQSSLSLSPTANSLMIPKFEIAYQELTDQQHERVILNIEEVDSFLNLIISDTLLIIGETRFTNLLISRLYINASLNYYFRSKLQQKKGSIITKKGLMPL